MDKLVVLVAIVAVLAVGINEYLKRSAGDGLSMKSFQSLSGAGYISSEGTQDLYSSFRCDGRQHCSDMSSCAEATFFIQRCPNTKMDGDSDGIPCESQWCGQ